MPRSGRGHTSSVSASGPSLYQIIEADPGCTIDELRVAYRVRARALHPDVSGMDDNGRSMAELNEAWRVLSDPSARLAYDQQALPIPDSQSRYASHSNQPRDAAQSQQQGSTSDERQAYDPRPTTGEAWAIGIQTQIRRLSQMAGRSATQTLLLRSPRAGREAYDGLVALIVEDLTVDTEARGRAARAAGAAPLDLGVAATLIGVRTVADRVRRQASLGVSNELIMTAELLDRMWDVLAHELPKVLEVALGSNPNVAKTLTL